MLRSNYYLKKLTPGFEEGTGIWRRYALESDVAGQELPRTMVFVTVDNLGWMQYEHVSNWISPVLRLRLRIAKEKLGGAPCMVSDEKVVLLEDYIDRNVLIKFPMDYPSQAPYFFVDYPKYREIDDGHAHHLYKGGLLCALRQPGEWSADSDTIISGMNVVIKWLVWHHATFGW
jgi:hypothetical protein